ncbi:hypothetical protein K466DRAFT_570078 [Polyporus arcularius HHB13444]|uniref:Uncharacterized protein n=1 Tax=Polyporus arcularius HHB13444 TaxID=1314778 RepID=A0A5C3NRR3_9APHY|nr:hypothetical protein K466DRAFT_570078 [Polyporus arcularius HHB13444]
MRVATRTSTSRSVSPTHYVSPPDRDISYECDATPIQISAFGKVVYWRHSWHIARDRCARGGQHRKKPIYGFPSSVRWQHGRTVAVPTPIASGLKSSRCKESGAVMASTCPQASVDPPHGHTSTEVARRLQLRNSSAVLMQLLPANVVHAVMRRDVVPSVCGTSRSLAGAVSLALYLARSRRGQEQVFQPASRTLHAPQVPALVLCGSCRTRPKAASPVGLETSLYHATNSPATAPAVIPTRACCPRDSLSISRPLSVTTAGLLWDRGQTALRVVADSRESSHRYARTTFPIARRGRSASQELTGQARQPALTNASKGHGDRPGAALIEPSTDRTVPATCRTTGTGRVSSQTRLQSCVARLAAPGGIIVQLAGCRHEEGTRSVPRRPLGLASCRPHEAALPGTAVTSSAEGSYSSSTRLRKRCDQSVKGSAEIRCWPGRGPRWLVHKRLSGRSQGQRRVDVHRLNALSPSASRASSKTSRGQTVRVHGARRDMRRRQTRLAQRRRSRTASHLVERVGRTLGARASSGREVRQNARFSM